MVPNNDVLVRASAIWFQIIHSRVRDKFMNTKNNNLVEMIGTELDSSNDYYFQLFFHAQNTAKITTLITVRRVKH